MSERFFMMLVPVWIGILGNLVLTVFNVSAGFGQKNRFLDWYFTNFGGLVILGGMWCFLLGWSAYNYFWGYA